MKRPALCVTVPYVLGLVLTSVFVRQLWIPVGGVVLTAVVLLLWRRDMWKYVLLGTLSCLTACCVYWCKDVSFVQQAALQGQEAVFEGTVTSVTVYQSGYARYYLEGTFEDVSLQELPAKAELFCEQTDYIPGDALTLYGRPEEQTSGYLFDNAAYARSQGICLRFGNETEILENPDAVRKDIHRVLYKWRTAMCQRILAKMGEETGPMLTGMLFGDKSGMSRDSRNSLYRMGIGHVLAVSGLHLDFLALCVSWALKKLRVGRYTACGLMAVLCGLFVLCAGGTVSVKRACIMILLREGGKLVYRQSDALNSLSIASFLLCLQNPFVIHGAAFWLSCSATWGIAVFAPYMMQKCKTDTVPRQLRKLLRSFIGSCWASVAILPVSALYFREVSLLSPVSNTLLVPLCMLSMLLGALSLLSGMKFTLPLQGAELLNSIILHVSHSMACISWTHAATGSQVLLPLLFAGVFLVLGCVVLKQSKRFTAGMIALSLAVTCIAVGTEQAIYRRTLRIAVLGENRNCVLVLTAGNEAVVFDMTGNAGLAAYANAYLTENGVGCLTTLYLCKPSVKSAQKYTQYFSLLPPEQLTFLKEADEDIPDILGTVPEVQSRQEMLFYGARITAEETCVTVEYDGMTFVCGREYAVSGETDVPTDTPEVLVVYGRNQKTLLECGILVVYDADSPYRSDRHTYIGEQNLELTITENGTCRMRRLYVDT